MQDSPLIFDNVTALYEAEQPILNDISYHFKPGSFHFLTGISGAGKSTFLKLMSMEKLPSSGKVLLFSHDTKSLSRDERALFRQKIGIVFQDFRLLDHLTILENVALSLRFSSNLEETSKDHVIELLNWVHLGDKINVYPPSLSGGEKQRVAIARAVINRPSLLIADEPTGNVDDEMAVKIISLFEQLNKLGTTIILATHNENLIKSYDYPILRIENHQLYLSASNIREAS